MAQESTPSAQDSQYNTNFGAKTTNNFQRSRSLNSDRKMSNSYAHIPMRKDVPHWNVSAAVLRHSVTNFSIPKDVRFKEPKINYYNHLQLQYPSSLSNRGTNFGYGKKVQIPEVFSQNKNEATQGVPFYEVDDMTLRRNKSEIIKRGKTIGQSWSSFKEARAPHRNTVHCPEQVKANPGHKYIIHTKTGEDAPKSTIHSRLRMFSDIRAYNKRDEPGPLNYAITETQVKRSGSKTNFGLGKKSDFTDNPELAATPGPVYNISGFCDKFSNTKLKNLGRGWK